MNKPYIYEEKKIGKYTVKVVQDDDPMNPRVDYDNLGHMICFHRNYRLGDKHSFTDSRDEELVNLLKDKNVLWLPLYLYDHSGITMNTTGFSCVWDSGQVGYIYITKDEWRKWQGVKRVNKKKVYDYMRSEVKDYDNYLTGEVYGFIIEDETGASVDSCWGFNGDSKYALEEGICAAQSNIRWDIKQHMKQLKQWIRNRVPLEKREALSI